jgi:hypothetical protein
MIHGTRNVAATCPSMHRFRLPQRLGRLDSLLRLHAGLNDGDFSPIPR